MWNTFIFEGMRFASQKYSEDMGNAYFPCRDKNGDSEYITKRHLLRHLQGKTTYAVYQLSKENTVKWLCLDIDGGERNDLVALALAREIYKFFGENTFLIENSGSKGYHIWIFFDEPLPAGYAKSLGHMLSQRVERPQGCIIEVFPKQSSIRLTGSAVKLPLGIHQKTQNRCLFHEPTKEGLKEYPNQWEALKNVKPLSSKMVMQRFEEFEGGKPKEQMRPENTPSCLINIMEYGVNAGFKDEPAFRLACYFRSKGIPESMALSSLEEWNTRNSDPIEDSVLERKVQSAYDGEYSYFPCNSELFDHVCVSTCPFYANKEKFRWKDKSKSSIGVLCKE